MFGDNFKSLIHILYCLWDGSWVCSVTSVCDIVLWCWTAECGVVKTGRRRCGRLHTVAVGSVWLWIVHVVNLNSPHLTSFHLNWIRVWLVAAMQTGSLHSAYPHLSWIRPVTDEMRSLEIGRMRWGEISDVNTPSLRYVCPTGTAVESASSVDDRSRLKLSS